MPQSEISSSYDLMEIIKKQYIFRNFSEQEIRIVAPFCSLNYLQKHERLSDSKNNLPTEIYIVLSGTLIAGTSISSNSTENLKEYTAGEIVNLMSFYKKNTKQLEALAIEPSTLLVIDIDAMQKDNNFQLIQPKLSQRIIKYFSDRLKYTEIILDKTANLATDAIQQRLEESKLRITYGIFLVQTIILMCLYIYGLEILDFLNVKNIFVVSAIILFIISLFLLSFMHRSGLPLKAFGLTTKDWQRSLIEGLLCTIFLLIGEIIVKYIVIEFFSENKHIPLIDNQLYFNNIFSENSKFILYSLIVYAFFVPLQEFVVRGGLQTSFFRFLSGDYNKKNWTAIIISNFIFMTFHLHISFIFAIASFVPGLVWGWLFSRNRTLLGVSVSHILFGIISMYVINIERIFNVGSFLS